MTWTETVANMDEIKTAYKILVGKSRRRWEDNIRMDFRETVGTCGFDIHLTYDRGQWRAVVNFVMKFRVPEEAGNSYWLAERVLASQDGL
jgi:hypothetical protein